MNDMTDTAGADDSLFQRWLMPARPKAELWRTVVGGLIVVLIWMAWSFFAILAGMISGVLREEGLRGMMGQAPVVLPYPETVLLSVMLLVTFAGLWLGVMSPGSGISVLAASRQEGRWLCGVGCDS